MTFTPITEDDVGNPGNLVSDLIGSAITDADAGAAEGIAIHALSATNGHLEFSVDDGQTWIDVGTVSNSSALLLRDTDRIRFVPNGNNEGSAGIVYWAWDQTTGVAGTRVDATVRGGSTAFSTDAELATVSASGVNDAPVITSNGGGETAGTAVSENTTYVTTVAATDVDVPVQTLTYSIVGGGDAGKFTIDGATGALSFAVAPSYESPQGSLSGGWVYEVTVGVSDGVATDTQTLNVIVYNVNDAPVITSDGGGETASVSVAENTLAVTTVIASDEDFGATSFTYSIVGGADSGRFNIDSSTGALSFVAAPDFEFPADSDSDNTYEVIVRAADASGGADTQTITVTVANVNEHPVAANDSASADEGTTITGNVLTNDIDAESSTLTAALVSGPTHGSLTLDADGSFSYTPDANFHGTDTFTYQANDGNLDSNIATVTITVNPVNDAPTTSPVTLTAIAEDSGPRLITQAELLANAGDVDGDSLTATALTISSGNGSLVDNGNGTWTYTPAANDDTAVSFSYTVTDGSLTVPGSATLDITPVNDAPVANNDSASGDEDTTITGNVLANDTDVEHDDLTASLVTGPAHGSLTLNPDGSFSYTPDADWHGTDSFTYQANDGALDSNLATVTITVDPVNDAPVATADSYITAEDSAHRHPRRRRPAAQRQRPRRRHPDGQHHAGGRCRPRHPAAQRRRQLQLYPRHRLHRRGQLHL